MIDKSIPALPDTKDAAFLEKLKEAVEVRFALRGADELDSVPTWRQLIEFGIAGLVANGATYSGSGGTVGDNTITTGTQVSVDTETIDYTTITDIPNPPTNVQFSEVFGSVLITWDLWQPFVQRALIYRAEITTGTPNPQFATDAVLAGTADFVVYTETLPQAKEYRYWIKFVSYAGVESALHDINGTDVSTSTDPAVVLALLEGQINRTHLASVLEDEIDTMIGDINTIEDTVNHPVTGLAQAYGLAQTNAADVTVVEGDISRIDGDLTVLSDAVYDPTTGLSASYLIATNNTAEITRVDDDVIATTSSLNALVATVEEPSTGLAATYALANSFTGEITRIDGDITSVQSSVSALSSTVEHPTTGVAATYTIANTNTGQIAIIDGKVDGAVSDINQVEIDLGATNAAIAQETSIRSTETGSLLANWSVKAELDVGDGVTYLTGFGLSQEVIDGDPVSSFIVKATQFAVGFPGSNNFTLTSGPVDGVPTIGISNANIIDLAVTDGKIFNLQAAKLFAIDAAFRNVVVEDALISSAKLSNVIQSDNFDPAEIIGYDPEGKPIREPGAGWRLITRDDASGPSGSLECHNVVARGDIEASSLVAGSANIVDTIHLRGQAVTFPTWAANNSPVAFPLHTSDAFVTETGWAPCAGIGISSTEGAPISISMSTAFIHPDATFPIDLLALAVVGKYHFVFETRAVRAGVGVVRQPTESMSFLVIKDTDANIEKEVTDSNAGTIIYNFIENLAKGESALFQIEARIRCVGGPTGVTSFRIQTLNPMGLIRQYESSVGIELKK